MLLSFDLSTLIILNALAYFLAVPANMHQWYFFSAEGIILFFNLLVIWKLIKTEEWAFLFFFLVITMVLKPFYLFTNIIVDDFVPMISIMKAVLLFILTMAVEKSEGKK